MRGLQGFYPALSGVEQYVSVLFYCFHSQAYSEMGFPGPGRAEEDNVFRFSDVGS